MHSVTRMLTKLLRGLGTPLALEQLKKLETEGLAALTQSTPPDPLSYTDALQYRLDTQAVEIVRKLWLEDDESVKRRYEAAVSTFYACESANRDTNLRLGRYLVNHNLVGQEAAVMRFITAWRKEIRRVLGKAPALPGLCFSQGSTLSDAGLYTTIPDKMSSVQTVYDHTTELAKLARPFYPVMNRHPWLVRDGNVFFTVPKDSSKDRGCCMEASLNIAMQLAVGRVMRTRYKRAYNADLRRLQEDHRLLAQMASVDGTLATIDLSNASDTVAKRLVQLVMPDDWYELLFSLRASHTDVDGLKVKLEKFSSMGNGFTFELETVLFRTMAAVITDYSPACSAYGDDIIVPSQYGKAMIGCLQHFGFTPNVKKTFLEGPFRESCGGDFFNGQPVRAHYMKTLPDEPSKWVALANGLRRFDPELRFVRAAWRFCIDQLPTEWRNFGPADLGDLLIWDPEAKPQIRDVKASDYARSKRKSSLPCWRVMRPVARGFDLQKIKDVDAAIAAASMGVSRFVVPRKSVTGFVPDWVVAWGLAQVPVDDEWYPLHEDLSSALITL